MHCTYMYVAVKSFAYFPVIVTFLDRNFGAIPMWDCLYRVRLRDAGLGALDI